MAIPLINGVTPFTLPVGASSVLPIGGTWKTNVARIQRNHIGNTEKYCRFNRRHGGRSMFLRSYYKILNNELNYQIMNYDTSLSQNSGLKPHL